MRRLTICVMLSTMPGCAAFEPQSYDTRVYQVVPADPHRGVGAQEFVRLPNIATPNAPQPSAIDQIERKSAEALLWLTFPVWYLMYGPSI